MFSAHAMHGLLVPRLITTDGNVVVPNGASMRPNTAVQQRIVRAARGVDSCVYCVDAGAFTIPVYCFTWEGRGAVY